jgi:hypothetical protein
MRYDISYIEQFALAANTLLPVFISVLKRKISTGKRRMHKPEEPLPFPLHVRIFVIIPFSAAAGCFLSNPNTNNQKGDGSRESGRKS